MQFLLPNCPLLPDGITEYKDCSYSELVELNGNHWRKILTIIAKLSRDDGEDWRIVRDQYIWRKASMVFSVDALCSESDWQIIVGKTFLQQLPIPSEATCIESGRHQVFVENRRIWTPYLDYRQFPNVLIDELRKEIRK